tara:strand:+ start:1579 stop:2289 length:711 start_codon:yes stop_codon:yes gene_type:complete
MSTFWNNLSAGYYDKLIINGIDKNRGIQANWHNLTFLEVKKLVTDKNKHLDFACGSGTFIGYYLQQDSVGVDISEKQIEYANTKYNKVGNFITLKEFNEIIKKDSFDVITVLGLFEFISDSEVQKLMEKLKDILNANGKIVITFPSFNKLFDILLSISSSIGNVDYSEEHHKRKDLESLIKIFQDLEFKKIKVSKIINLGIFFSFFNLKLGEKINNFFAKMFNNRFGFLYLIEISN